MLNFFPHAEGYVTALGDASGYKFFYVYNYLDHLGNIRVSYGVDPKDGVLKILEENHYYPYGLKHTNYNGQKRKYEKELDLGQQQEMIHYQIKQILAGEYVPYKYKYNGKEYQDELGLNMYDYGAMLYDPALGRRNNIDPKAEESRRWSPYTYCYNNPIRFVDPDGMQGQDWIQRGKEFFYDPTIKTQEQAKSVYGNEVNHLNDGSKIVAKDGSYEYNLNNSNGTVTDCSGTIVDTSQNVTTPGGNTIISPNSKDGIYCGLGIGGSLGGGISLELGIVLDATGNFGAYFSFGGNVGLSADAGFKAGGIEPTANNPFALNDFEGNSNSYSGGIGPFGGEYGGSDGSNETGKSRMNPQSFGQNKRGYMTTSQTTSLITPGPKVNLGAQFTGSKTWVWDF
jgi:RHS repeat-associated protein